MDKITSTIKKWDDRKVLAETSRQNQIMNGATKKEISAIDAYLGMFGEFINDLNSFLR